MFVHSTILPMAFSQGSGHVYKPPPVSACSMHEFSLTIYEGFNMSTSEIYWFPIYAW